MNKPTIFFSHSSKDKDLIKSIQDKLKKCTGGVLDIFMSSDGQSIPFGTNWIHKIEDGLNNAKIMFVFVTENSISSGWIYFEAGFAYSKGIRVIPVGIGVDIGALKAPLNLLQGFNILSADSLNNFISIINKEFTYSFDENFTSQDYSEIVSVSISDATSADFNGLINSVRFKLLANYGNGERRVDIDRFFNQIINYLNQNSIPYSIQSFYRNSSTSCIAVRGIKIVYQKTYEAKLTGDKIKINWGHIEISISPYNFAESFEIYREICMLLEENTTFYLYIRLDKPYSYITSDEDCAALIASAPERFTFDRDHVGRYRCDDLGLELSIFDVNFYNSRESADFVLSVIFDPQKTHASDIIKLVSRLYELKLIYKKTGEQNNA